MRTAVALILAMLASGGAASQAPLTGHYADETLRALKHFTLPRIFVYDSRDRLIPQERWPSELRAVKALAGEAYCCVSQQPSAPDGGPPADCVKIPYGTDMHENFAGLKASDGTPIEPARLPPHRWLLVEYHADWCAPCRLEEQALRDFFTDSARRRGFVWLRIDVTRLAEAGSAQ
jgi:hypothetical protein